MISERTTVADAIEGLMLRAIVKIQRWKKEEREALEEPGSCSRINVKHLGLEVQLLI